jgi:hypothetical protein
MDGRVSKEAVDPIMLNAVKQSWDAWFESYGLIKDADGQWRGRNQEETLQANYMQRQISRIIEWCIANDIPIRLLLLKPRQRGCSTFSSAGLYQEANKRQMNGVIIGAKKDQAKNLFKMVNQYSNNDECDWGTKRNCGAESAKFDFADGKASEISILSAKEFDPGRSGTYQFVLATEVARWSEEGVSNAADVLSGLLKCVQLKPGTIVIQETTAQGACYDAETEILTDEGWKFFKDLRGDEGILSKDRETGVSYYESTWKKQVHKFKGEMVRFKSKNLDLRVTSNHNMWMARQKGPMQFIEAGSTKGKTTDYYFEKTLNWNGKGLDSVTIPSYRHIQGNGERVLPAVTIPMDKWLRFLGYFLSDGNVRYSIGCKQVCLTQVKFANEFFLAAQDIADALGCRLHSYEKGNGFVFCIVNAQFADYMRKFSMPKRIPRELLMGLSRKQCRDLIDYIYLGDGCLCRREVANSKGKDYGRVYAGVDKEFADDLCELYLKAGYGASVREKEVDGYQKVYIASFTSGKRACQKFDNPPTFEADCDETVYCVTLPKDHLLMVRRGGRSVWCGNSGDFFERWTGGALDFEEFKRRFEAGEKMEGKYIRIFTPWYRFPELSHDLTPEQQDRVSQSLSKVERYNSPDFGNEHDIMARFGLSLGQISWRRYAIDEECKRDPRVFEQDYPSTWESAFLTSGNRRFNSAGVRYMRKQAQSHPCEYGMLEASAQNEKRVSWRPTDSGEGLIQRWEEPREGNRYLIAVDVMTGFDQTTGKDPDRHSALVLRAGKWLHGQGWVRPALVARIKSPCQWEVDLLGEWVKRLHYYYRGSLIVPEINNPGLALLQVLKPWGLPIYQREVFDELQKKITKQLGFKTTPATKPMVIANLARAIREYDTEGSGFDIWDENAINELGSFVRKPDGKEEAMDGMHDDDVMALAIGLTLIDEAVTYWNLQDHFQLPSDLRGSQPQPGHISQYS